MVNLFKTNDSIPTLCCKEIIPKDKEVSVIFELSNDDYVMVVYDNKGHKISIDLFNKNVVLEDVDEST